MVEKKNPDDNLFNDNFEDDFDFGEEPNDTGTKTQTTVVKKSKPKMGILIISGTVVLLLTLYMGWKFLSKSSTPNIAVDKNLLSKTTEPAPKPQITEADLPKSEITVLTTPPVLPSQAPPKIEPKIEEPKTEVKPENGMNDIAQAFSSADQTPQPKESSSALKEIQKELFSSPSTAPTSAPIQSTDNKAHPEITAGQTTEAMDAMLKLSQQMEYTVNQIKQLDAYTRDISQTIAKLNIDINAMDNRILALTNTTSSLSKDMGVVKSEVGRYKQPGSPAVGVAVREVEEVYDEPVIRKAAPGCPMPVEPEYVVHAVIPGRAWLKTSKGQIITVTEGETVGNYGKILVIDAANGVVLTNSGITFR